VGSNPAGRAKASIHVTNSQAVLLRGTEADS